MIRHWNPIFIQSSTQYVTTLPNALYIFLYIDWKRPKCCISNILTVGTDEDYSRDAYSMLNNIYKYTSFLQSLGLYLCWWTFSPLRYHQLSSQSFGTDMIYQIYVLLKFLK